MAKAPVVNSYLADLFSKEPDPFEALADDQRSALSWRWTLGSQPDLLKHGRLVTLKCGHFTVTRSLHRAKCRRCGEMIRAGYDYDSFRNRGGADSFSWPDDPLRTLHERDEQMDHIHKYSPV
uniref:Uncharacterized protein n=1 Tax=Burkholderia sp. M701 TaxID=326454 RepID=V5YN61_9BURK|nr:hypothetical protein [Burkholderia sp. M701]BAO18842.1 hypothetical protein [Burkholderia sp. M701]